MNPHLVIFGLNIYFAAMYQEIYENKPKHFIVEISNTLIPLRSFILWLLLVGLIIIMIQNFQGELNLFVFNFNPFLYKIIFKK